MSVTVMYDEPDPSHPSRSIGLDGLTGLPGGRQFGAWLQQLLSAGHHRFAVCLVDIDRFDAVNRGLGRRVGDLLLVTAARRLAALAERDGQRLARISGNRFALLADSAAYAGDVTRVADKVLTTLRQPFEVASHRLAITASAGLVVGMPKAVSSDEIMRSAGVALQWAKADGRARHRLFDHERDAREVARHQLSLEMPSAMACDKFVLRYQPLIDLHDGHLAGFEALARWQHPVHGLLQPDQFIGIAEDTGLIVALGARLLRLACEEAARWPASAVGSPYVSVNLAAAQLQHPSLEATVVRTLEHTGLPPERLRLEITEHSVIDTAGPTLATLQKLTGYGVRVALDDFGTGYSNLATLPRLPISELKLAQPFVQGFGDERGAEASRAFLQSVISLGHSLDLTTTAEGIETAQQADLMRELGCDTGQGWLFGKPLPAPLVQRFIRHAGQDARPAGSAMTASLV